MGTIFRGKDFCGRLVDDVSNDRTLFVTGYRPPIIIKNWRVTLTIAKLWRAEFFLYQVPRSLPKTPIAQKNNISLPVYTKAQVFLILTLTGSPIILQFIVTGTRTNPLSLNQVTKMGAITIFLQARIDICNESFSLMFLCTMN